MKQPKFILAGKEDSIIPEKFRVGVTRWQIIKFCLKHAAPNSSFFMKPIVDWYKRIGQKIILVKK